MPTIKPKAYIGTVDSTRKYDISVAIFKFACKLTEYIARVSDLRADCTVRKLSLNRCMR